MTTATKTRAPVDQKSSRFPPSEELKKLADELRRIVHEADWEFHLAENLDGSLVDASRVYDREGVLFEVCCTVDTEDGLLEVSVSADGWPRYTPVDRQGMPLVPPWPPLRGRDGRWDRKREDDGFRASERSYKTFIAEREKMRVWLEYIGATTGQTAFKWEQGAWPPIHAEIHAQDARSMHFAPSINEPPRERGTGRELHLRPGELERLRQGGWRG